MSKTSNLVIWVAILFEAFFLIYWIRIYENELIAFDEFVLDKQVNYAADAAVEELLNTGDTDQDYNEGKYMVVEPELAVTEFTSILTEDFNMVPTDFTRTMIQQKYVKSLLICTWDGVYAYWLQPVNNTNEYQFVGTPKIPYFYTDDNGKQYCLNLGFEEVYSDTGDESSYKLQKYHELAPNELSKDMQLMAINEEVASILNYTLIQSYGGNNRTAYEIPALASDIRGSQPVDQITVIGVVEGQATSLATAITAECIGGAQVTQADPVIGVKVRLLGDASNHITKVYAYSSWWSSHPNLGTVQLLNESGGVASNLAAAKTEYFDTPFEAAEAGYYDLLTSLEKGEGNPDEEED